MNFNSNIPKEVLEVINTLEKGGFEAYLVGGCVRDLILEKEPKDWDVTTNATPEEIQGLFPDSFYENQFGTVGVKTRSEKPNLAIVEVTPYRLEGKYSDRRHPDSVTFSQKIEDDLARRDFTINALAYNPNKGQVIDLYQGQKDIKDKVLRTVGDPDSRFNEDALRMLRAIRFCSELGFMINSDTYNSIYKLNSFMGNVSRERVRDEFTKIIMSDSPIIGLNLAEKLGILEYISPNLVQMVGVDQNKQAHKYDVWEHSLRTLQHSADQKFSLEIRLSALFHDIGKPASKREKGNKTTFYGHDVIGANVTRETLSDLNYPKETIETVVKLVRWHMFFSDTEEITHSAVRRLIRNVGKDNIWSLINLRKCDRIGTGRPVEEPYRLRQFEAMLDEVLADPIEVSMLKINGETLIKELHMKPGPRIGYILHALLEIVLEDPYKNDQVFLVKQAEELNNLSDYELKKIGEAGKEAKNDAREEELHKIKTRRKIK